MSTGGESSLKHWLCYDTFFFRAAAAGRFAEMGQNVESEVKYKKKLCLLVVARKLTTPDSGLTYNEIT